MKTLFYSMCYLNGPDFGGTRLQRTKKFLSYYLNQPIIKFHDVILCDNGSDLELLEELPSMVRIKSYPHIPRKSDRDFPHSGRFFWYLKDLILSGQYDKIVWCDDDGFVLTQRFADWINQTNTGFQTVWCPKYGFPNGSPTILCKDAFELYLDFHPGDDFMLHNNPEKPLEELLPFTHVEKGFNCDRWGEERLPQEPYMDFYYQCPVDIEMKFNIGM